MTVAEGNAGTTTPPSPSPCRAPSGQTVTRRLRDRERHGDRAGRLHGAAGTLDVRPGRDDEDRHRPGRRRLLDEPDETFFVNLSNPSNATIADGQGLGTITDDDARRRCRSTT